MTDFTLKPYVVTLSFGQGGPLFVNALLAPTPEAATGMLAVIVMREHVPPQPLIGCMAMELTPDFLRLALRAVEGKLPPGGQAEVLSLVQPPAAPQVDQAPQDDPPPAA